MPDGRGRCTGGSPTESSPPMRAHPQRTAMTTPNPFDAALLHRAQRSEEHAARLATPEQAHQRRALLKEAEILRGLADRNTADRSPHARTRPPAAAAP